MRLIDADALKQRAIRVSTVKEHCYMKAVGTHEIDKAPTIDAVSRGVLDQVRWERDIALEQLADYGLSLGERADVVKVVRCKDCKHRKEKTCFHPCGGMWVGVELKDNDFCSHGERKHND